MILVTGATGFIGPKVVHALRAREQPVRVVVREPRDASQLAGWGAEVVQGDMTDPASLREAVRGVERIIHLVAIIQGSPEQFERIMAQGTRDLVAAAKEEGISRFVLQSALGTSDTEAENTVPYFKAKHAMEEAVKGSGLEYVIFRPSFVFGADGGVLPLFIRQVRWSPVTPVLGPGRQRSQPIWVEDVAAYLAEGAQRPDAAGQTFELGGPDTVDWNELYARIAKVLGKRRLQLHIPFGVARLGAGVAERLPKTPVTRDQIEMLAGADNVATNSNAVETFKLPLVPLDEQIRRAA